MTKLDWESCYSVLELRPEATLEEVEKSWKRLSKLNHPDQHRQGSKSYFLALEKQKQLNAAHDILKAGLSARAQTPPGNPAAAAPPPAEPEIKVSTKQKQAAWSESAFFWLSLLGGSFLFFLSLCRDLLRMLLPCLAVENHPFFCDLVSVIAFGITTWLFLRLLKLSETKT